MQDHQLRLALEPVLGLDLELKQAFLPALEPEPERKQAPVLKPAFLQAPTLERERRRAFLPARAPELAQLQQLLLEQLALLLILPIQHLLEQGLVPVVLLKLTLA